MVKTNNGKFQVTSRISKTVLVCFLENQNIMTVHLVALVRKIDL